MGNWMKACLLLVAVLAVNAAPPTHTEPIIPGSRIVGGIAVDIANFPYQLSLRVNNIHICGASIISADFALTAAHCVKQPMNVITLVAGTSSKTTGGYTHYVKHITVPSLYNTKPKDYDFAVVQVKTPFNLGAKGVRAIALPALNENVTAGLMATSSGWGQMNGSDSTSSPIKLHAVNVTIVDQSTCKLKWAGKEEITDSMICAGGRPTGGVGSCMGDSGGPLTIKSPTGPLLVGVVSFGQPCALPDYPDVYARTAKLSTWIKTAANL